MLLTSPTSTTPTTLKPATAALHLLDDDEEEEEDEGQSWKRWPFFIDLLFFPHFLLH